MVVIWKLTTELRSQDEQKLTEKIWLGKPSFRQLKMALIDQLSMPISYNDMTKVDQGETVITKDSPPTRIELRASSIEKGEHYLE